MWGDLMRSLHYNSRTWRRVAIFVMLTGAILIVVAVKWAGNVPKRHDSQQTATMPKAPPILVEDRQYEGCGHRVEKEQELSAEFRLLSPKELAQLHNAATYQVSEERLRIFNHEPGLCPECKRHIFVGLDGEEVAVFYGLPGGPRQLRERTPIRMERLPPQAVSDLKLGIPVNSQEELLQVLEGLMN